MAVMRAGKLRHHVDILAPDATLDDWGDTTQSPTVDATVRAEIMPISFAVSERLVRSGVQVQEEMTHRVVIRYRDGVTAANKLRFDGRVFEILSVANIQERGFMLEILCREVV